MQIKAVIILLCIIVYAVVFIACSENGMPVEDPATVTRSVSTPTAAEPENRLTENAVTIIYEEEPSVRYTELYGSRVFSGCPGYSCEYNKVSYTFPESVDEDRRSEVVVKTDEILTQLEQETGCTRQEGLEINILKEEYEARIYENKLYIGYSSFGGLEYALGVAQACLGTEVDYGLIYGLCCSLAETLDYEVEEPIAIDDALNLNERSLLDMNYACFMERYAGKDLVKIKAVSRAFFNSLTYEERSSLCCQYNDEEFNNCLNRFLVLNGQEEYHNSDIWNIRIMNGGEDVRLFWQDEWADYYLMENYQEISTDVYKEYGFQGYGENPMNSDYADLRHHIIAAHNQLEYVREKIEPYVEIPDERIDVCYTERSLTKQYIGGWFDGRANKIEPYAITTVGHEYAHFLLKDALKGKYYLEHMVCYYLGYTTPIDECMDSGLIIYKWHYEELLHNEEVLKLDPAARKLYPRLRNYLGREIDLSNEYDVMCMLQNEIIDRFDRRNVLTIEDWPGAGETKAAFVAFLVSEHGEDNVLEAILTDTPDTIGYETWETAVDEWEVWIEKEFGSE